METAALSKMIDLTLLKPEATPVEIAGLCTEAKRLGCAAVCVQPKHVERVAQYLTGSSVLPITVVGFPHGMNEPAIKGTEAGLAIMRGAKEIDMVIDVGALKWNDDEAVLKDIRAVTEVCRPMNVPVKVILETAALTSEEITRACRLAEEAGAQYVKTSTGFHAKGGATVEVIALMHAAVGGRLGIKASGGIRDRATALAMIAAGATRIGASNATAILAP
jgi:deoxyribose-phosphate aldolase